MSNCGNKIKNTCGSPTYATCVEYEGELPEFSEIEGCPVIEETTAELYTLIGKIKEETDLSALGDLCLTYVQEDSKTIVKNVLLKFEEEICTLKEKITTLENTGICDQSISGCDLDYDDLVDNCGNIPTTMAGVLQLILDNLNTP